VCHNTRTSKGRFSVETYASLMKGGESGPAVIPGDADGSNLWLLVDSGEMPKDGDPLPAEHAAILKRWISEGANIGDESLASKTLTSIMPKPQQPLPPEHYASPVPVTALALHQHTIAVSGYREVLVFNIDDGHLVRRIQNLAERIYTLAFSPDGKLLAVAAGTPARLGEVKLYGADTGELVADLATAGDSFFDVNFSPDGTRLAAAGSDRTIRIWNVVDQVETLRIEDHADWVSAVAFSPDGTRLATASRDKTAKVFDAASGEAIATFNEHEQPVQDVLFNSDGSRVVSCGKDNRVRVWEVADAKQKKSEKLPGEATSLCHLGEDAFVVGCTDGKARVYDFEAEQRSSFKLDDWVLTIAVSPNGQHIAVGTYDGVITLRDSASNETVRTLSAMPPKD
jgi:WD40 repeat protein